MDKIYSNEIVFRGHPDKVCDQISGAILTALLKQDKNTRAGIETAIKNNKIILLGEVTTKAKIDYRKIALDTMIKIGYSGKYKITNLITEQSPDIALGVDKDGAGDQGMMFGYACDETPQYLPKAMVILQELAKWYDIMVRNKIGFKPDGKAQITGIYDDKFRLKRIDTFLVSYCNNENDRPRLDKIIMNEIIALCRRHGLKAPSRILINPTGKFEIGGPDADAGLTGRKIVVDAYQSFANVGGGCMNGKDPTKVDLSGAHKARQIAVDLVKYGYCKWCEVQLAYAIGKPEPLSIHIESDNGNLLVSPDLYKQCSVKNIIRDLNMLDLDYEELAKFGHFTK